MRIAYADPPYLGCAKIYGDDLTYDDPEAHRALIGRLNEYDAWALSLHAPSLFVIRPMCPPDARVLIWCKTWVNLGPADISGFLPYAWEPVIVRGGRRPPDGLRDWWGRCSRHEGIQGSQTGRLLSLDLRSIGP